MLSAGACERNGEPVRFIGVVMEATRWAATPLLAELHMTYAQVADRNENPLTGLSAARLPVTVAVAPYGQSLDRRIGGFHTGHSGELMSLWVADAARMP